MKADQHECGSASDLDLLIPTLLSCPDRNQACHTRLHIVRVGSQLTLSFPILHSVSQYEQSYAAM